MPQYDLVIAGAGIMGLASARALLQQFPGLRIAVLDKELAIGQHQTGHNSGVIHSGVYYAPGSLKARLCVQGSQGMYAYCSERGIPTDRCGKVIIAASDDELPRLHELHRRGVANGVAGMELIGPERLREIEPHCIGVQALWIPVTGICDYSAVARAYGEDIEQAGGEILLGRRVRGFAYQPDGVVVLTEGDEIYARYVLTCAGLYADRVARLSGSLPEPRIVPFRGDYWVLRPERRALVRNLIYPVPDPSFPFLGVHFTRRIVDGAVWLGPNAVLAFAREGYGRFDINPEDLRDALGFVGFRRLAYKYWQTGTMELLRDYSKRLFLRSLRRYIPELVLEDLLPGPAGVRAQALNAAGRLVDDFVVDGAGERIIHVRNAPSPAATSSLAIGRLICQRVSEAFHLGA
ncbi:MAG: L-2-hydroxyglutarate oxidase [Chloroflexi bacterium]|nr:L-2-hydroxyglutarate oxidase [Chloroflexota bacterium]